MAVHKLNDPEIFEVARKIDAHDTRQAYVQETCGEDLAQAERVLALLRAFEENASFLESPPVDLGTVPTFVPTVAEKPGTTIGPYRLLEQIGEGGMGVVYMAEQRQPVHRTVALKVIKPGTDTREVIARFDAERQALALMDHPNIARILDGGATETGRPYFVMDLVKGIPITEFCDQQKLSPRQRLELFVTVCRAVQHAHQKGIIHRDLKPTNILVERRDETSVPRVIDFGVSKAINQRLDGPTAFTQVSQMIGTPLYMSPEQARLTGVDVDTRSDVYSLGVLLYELLTGTTPFDKQTLREAGYDEIRRIIQEDEPPKPSDRISTLGASLQTISESRTTDPRRLGRIVQGELDWIVMKALEKDRNRRYETASALAADVERYLNDGTVEACPPSKSYRLRKYARRNKSVLVTAAVVVMSLLIGTGVSAWQAVEANEQRRVAEEQRHEAQAQRKVAVLERTNAVEERNSAVQQRKLALSNQYNAEIVSGQTDWQRGNIGGLHRKLVDHLPVQDEEDRRGWEWYYLFSLCHPEERTIFGGNGKLFASWSPDGEYVATAGCIWNARSGECVRQYSASEILRYAAAWSPDGKKFAWGMAADDNGIYIWDRGTDTVSSLRGHESSVWCLAWSPDGTQLASGSIDKTVRIWNVAQRSTVHTLTVDHIVTDVDWSPDGDLLAAAFVWETGLKIWKPATGEVFAEPAKPSGAMGVSWHPDGEQLAVCGNKGWSLLRRTDLSVIREEDHSTVGSGHDIAWNPDGTRLAVSHGEVVTVWNPAGEQPLVTLRGHLNPVNSLAWSPDGTHLVTADAFKEIRIWDWNAPIQPRPISTDGALESLAWQNDGRTLVAVSAEDHALSYWNAAEGSRIRIEQPKAEGPVLWSPDRRLLAVRAGTDENPKIQIVDAETEAVHSVWQGAAQHRLHKFVWSPDAAMLAIETTFEGDGNLVLWDVDREQTISRWEKEQYRSFGHIQWSDDSTRVAIATRGDVGDDGTVVHRIHAHIIDVATGKRILKHQLGGRIHTGNVTALAWSPSGQALACAGTQGLIEVLDVDSGHVGLSRKLHNAQIDALTWSPDGRRVASASQDGTVKVLAATSGAELLTFQFDEDSPKQLAWSPDGHRLAAATESGTIHVWDAGRGYEFSEDGSRRGELAMAYYQLSRPSGGEVERPALQEFLRLAPDTLGFWEWRGHANGRLGEYGRAGQEFAKAIGPDLQLCYAPAHYRAFTMLGTGDLEAYREVCAALVEEFQDSDVPSNRRNVAWLCVLSPNPPADSNTVLQMARAIHEHESPNDSEDDQVLTIGASLVRDGQYEEAVGTLTTLAEKLDHGGDATDEFQLACAEYFLALARHQQGHDVQARRYQAEAIRHADAYRQVGQNWTPLVALDALQREMEAALSKP